MNPDIIPADLMVFSMLAGLICGSALLCALSQDIVRSGFALLGTFGGIAGLYAFLGADFLMGAQLLIYVGGILVLILFAVLLTQRIQHLDVTNKSVGLPAGLTIAAIIAGGVSLVALKTPWPTGPVRTPNPTTARIGDAFLTDYLLPFELASIVLLVALIGAIVIARREVRPAGDP